jgi:tetratricopeptide (TPR) repeat protein
VAITGQGGVGKTTVGASVVAGWEGEIFWHTFHPGLNDDLNSLLFSLGHFTRTAGAPTLWAQLLAGEGRIVSISQAIGMLRIDLEHIATRRPLLCFDEVDLLQTAAADPRRKQHAQVLELLESLRGVAPLLLIGQRIYVDTDAHYALKPLPRPVTDELLRLLAVDIDAITAQRVHQFTDGNPRLLELYAAVWHSGDDASDVFRLPHEASAQPLFSRLWRRLSAEERELLSALSVFRSYAPRDAWANNEASLMELAHRGLIKTDLGSGVSLLPFIRDLVYEALTPERQQHFHQGAAHIRALRGDYTAAAHHYVQGGLPDAAVEIWFAHQEEEILSGQAAAAETTFREIKAEHVKGSRRAELRVIQNRLALLAGEVERVLEGMEAFRWDVEDETAADAIGQWAYAYELRDQNDLALEKYEEAMAMLSRAITKITFWHRQRGFTFTRESNPDAARREALQAMSDIERLQGMIDYWSGQFESAQNHYLTSLQFAEDAHDKSKIARSHLDLSSVAGRQGRIEEGREHAEIAISHYAEIGDRLAQESMRAELAGMYLNVRQFDTVIELAEKCLPFFERIKHERWVAAIANNLAEAYLETGQFDKSRAMVFRVLRMEIAPMRPHALYTLGHLHDREGNPAHAVVSFREGIEVARANSDPYIEAYLLRALGALLIKGGQAADGLEHLDSALKLFGEMGLAQEAAATEELKADAAPESAVTV